MAHTHFEASHPHSTTMNRAQKKQIVRATSYIHRENLPAHSKNEPMKYSKDLLKCTMQLWASFLTPKEQQLRKSAAEPLPLLPIPHFTIMTA